MRKFVLIDTPGFDDSHKDDLQILAVITNGLANTYRAGHKLSAVVYMHRIHDNRVGGSAVRSLAVMKKIVGPEAIDMIWLTTSHWGVTPRETALKHETTLMKDEDKWGSLIAKGAKTYRLDAKSAKSAARGLLRKIADAKPIPKTLLLQEQIVEKKLGFRYTSAALVLEGYQFIQHLLESKNRKYISASEFTKKLMEWIKSRVEESKDDEDDSTDEERKTRTKHVLKVVGRTVKDALKVLAPLMISSILTGGSSVFFTWLFSAAPVVVETAAPSLLELVWPVLAGFLLS